MEAANWIGFFFGGWGSGFSAYVALQSLALATLKKRFWYATALAVPLMLYVVFATIEAWVRGSNMWPILMIIGSPLAVLYLLSLTMVGLKIQGHPNRRVLTLAMLGIVVLATLPYVVMFTYAR
jgi:hypothetical protein